MDVVSLASRLRSELATYGPTVVAFSGGVDSSLVLVTAAKALGAEQVIAVTAVSPAVPVTEVDAARDFCRDLGVAHETIQTRELEVAGYRENGPTRCYFCKSTLVNAVLNLTIPRGFTALATGTNASDVAGGFRPGIRAAAERGVRTPLADLGFSKEAVRAVARHWAMPVWNKPAMPCLSSRIAYGVAITPQRLARVARAEAAVRALLGSASVRDLRVRDLGDMARVELDAHLVASFRDDAAIRHAVADAGFGDVPIRVEPFRSGSMNELLADPERWRQA